jgi:hypothetical protein
MSPTESFIKNQSLFNLLFWRLGNPRSRATSGESLLVRTLQSPGGYRVPHGKKE